jgi:hypothetical protein
MPMPMPIRSTLCEARLRRGPGAGRGVAGGGPGHCGCCCAGDEAGSRPCRPARRRHIAFACFDCRAGNARSARRFRQPGWPDRTGRSGQSGRAGCDRSRQHGSRVARGGAKQPSRVTQPVRQPVQPLPARHGSGGRSHGRRRHAGGGHSGTGPGLRPGGRFGTAPLAADPGSPRAAQGARQHGAAPADHPACRPERCVGPPRHLPLRPRAGRPVGVALAVVR